jgi:hypothetical protein
MQADDLDGALTSPKSFMITINNYRYAGVVATRNKAPEIRTLATEHTVPVSKKSLLVSQGMGDHRHDILK